ncbi:hypothetical protein PAXRUDRAFT_21755 [Paxillus rubicundulus Ve08.2h10]|uniref:Uncharacterized protein n=1 Tax=Paxillus rubicundulus Ve08.2h10 TaxID=930991 RepID=A0A0D0BLT4_9AGAM|nr:hypothetical protein PAXRUDRAFT_21755 [Paxillus rubicundulus Ve08.2h10]
MLSGKSTEINLKTKSYPGDITFSTSFSSRHGRRILIAAEMHVFSVEEVHVRNHLPKLAQACSPGAEVVDHAWNYLTTKGKRKETKAEPHDEAHTVMRVDSRRYSGGTERIREKQRKTAPHIFDLSILRLPGILYDRNQGRRFSGVQQAKEGGKCSTVPPRITASGVPIGAQRHRPSREDLTTTALGTPHRCTTRSLPRAKSRVAAEVPEAFDTVARPSSTPTTSLANALGPSTPPSTQTTWEEDIRTLQEQVNRLSQVAQVETLGRHIPVQDAPRTCPAIAKTPAGVSIQTAKSSPPVLDVCNCSWDETTQLVSELPWRKEVHSFISTLLDLSYARAVHLRLTRSMMLAPVCPHTACSHLNLF